MATARATVTRHKTQMRPARLKFMTNDADSTPYDFEAGQDEFAVMEFREELEKNLPPVSEIAQLAALLSHGHPLGSQTGEIYATHAINLWEWCYQKRKDWINKQAKMKLLRAERETKANELPKPEKFPAKYDDIVRLVLKIKRPEKQMEFYRAYARWDLEAEDYFNINYRKLPPPKESIADRVPGRVAVMRKRKLAEMEFSEVARHLLRWHEGWSREKRARRGAKGAAQMWKKHPERRKELPPGK